MKKCSEIQDILFYYLEEDLRGEEKVLVENHLRECPECAQYLSELEVSKKMLAGLPQVEAPPQLWNSILHGIREKNRRRRPGLAPVLQMKYFIPLATAAASILLAIYFLFPWSPAAPFHYTIVEYNSLSSAEKDYYTELYFKPLFNVLSDKEKPILFNNNSITEKPVKNKKS